MNIKGVGIIGCGLMGTSIAVVCLKKGFDILMYDITKEIVQDGIKKIEKVLNKTEGGAENRKALMRRVKGTLELRDFNSRDIVIEAIVEKLGEKTKIFGELDRVCKENAILASNTSSLSIIDIAASTKRIEQVLGMHFIAPAYMFPVVEIIRTIRTSEKVLETVKEFGTSLGMEVFVTKDYPGFVINNIQIPMLLQAVRVLEKDLATREVIDMVMTKGMGHRIGPLALVDYVGIDTIFNMAQSIYEETKDMIWAPPLLLRKMVAAGWLGRKTGKGFYSYD